MNKHLSETRTESLVLDLLTIQGWNTNKPPKGRVVRQNEYKNFEHLDGIFKGKSKTGRGGDAYPDFLLIDPSTKVPQMIVEAKAAEEDIESAIEEAKYYASSCMQEGHNVLAVGVAGQEEKGITVSVSKFRDGKWESVVYQDAPISWVPTPEDVSALLAELPKLDLSPIIPKPEILALKADFINRILREAAVKDEYRPAYVGAMMLAMWQSKGLLRRDKDHVLGDINQACRDAFDTSGKKDLALIGVTQLNSFSEENGRRFERNSLSTA